MNDPRDELLSPPPPPDTRLLREALLRRTTAVLRRRRWLRRAGLVVALAACYAGGLLTMHLAAPRDAPAVAPPPEETVAAPEGPSALPAPAVEDWAARAADAERAALYRRAGDRYLEAENNPEAALRCYTQSLDAAEEPFSPEDSWLLMAIKNAREKEKRHANDG